MTQLLAIVHDALEVAAVVAAGFDRVVVRAPRHEPLDLDTLRAIAAAARPRCAVTLWLEEAGPAPTAALTACAADALWGPPGRLAPAEVSRWLVPQGDGAEDTDLPDAHYAGMVIGAGDETRRLLGTMPVAVLEQRQRDAVGRGLAVVFAGIVEAPDVPRLLALAPNALLLDGLLRRDGEAGAPLDPQRLRVARGLVPVVSAAPSCAAEAAVVPVGLDRIFVRDWTVAIRIGAYAHERAAQRVRFTVEAEVAQKVARAADMRDVVTYDLILDAIGRATVAHVDLVETIAEDVARSILAHPRVVGVDVTVEKLDLGPGALGCRILRRREP